MCGLADSPDNCVTSRSASPLCPAAGPAAGLPRRLRAVAGQDSAGSEGGEILIGLTRLAEPWAVRVAATLRLADLIADGGTGLADRATCAGADPGGVRAGAAVRRDRAPAGAREPHGLVGEHQPWRHCHLQAKETSRPGPAAARAGGSRSARDRAVEPELPRAAPHCGRPGREDRIGEVCGRPARQV